MTKYQSDKKSNFFSHNQNDIELLNKKEMRLVNCTNESSLHL